jgi:hypothetical protein
MAHSQIDAVVDPIIFREYIGVKDFPDSLDDFPGNIINDDIPQFHFILGFGREDYDKDGKGTGNFRRTWNFDSFSPAKIVKLKEDHTNVKVIISIGGYGKEYPFDPIETSIWITKAQESIKVLIQDYENYLKDNTNCGCDIIIDGIDINYDHINSDKSVFSTCIGKVIKKLKNDSHVSKSMKVVSIAPTELVQTHYAQLYSDYKKYISWVDYKFYDQTLTTADAFVSLYNQLLTDYGTEVKLLAGVSTDPDSDTKTKREVFVEACTSLLKTASLSGIFVWNANNSATPSQHDSTPYFLEKILQNLLTNE